MSRVSFPTTESTDWMKDEMLEKQYVSHQYRNTRGASGRYKYHTPAPSPELLAKVFEKFLNLVQDAATSTPEITVTTSCMDKIEFLLRQQETLLKIVPEHESHLLASGYLSLMSEIITNDVLNDAQYQMDEYITLIV